MKKPLFIVLVLLFSFSFLTCKENSDNNDDKDKDKDKNDEPLVLDSRLVGGRWYYSYHFIFPDYERGYYEFTSDLKLLIKLPGSVFFEGQVHSKNGVVYSKDKRITLLQYEFINTYPYDEYDHDISSGDLYRANYLAKKGNLITCTGSYYSLYPDDVSYLWKFLVRFTKYDDPYDKPDDSL